MNKTISIILTVLMTLATIGSMTSVNYGIVWMVSHIYPAIINLGVDTSLLLAVPLWTMMLVYVLMSLWLYGVCIVYLIGCFFSERFRFGGKQ